MTHRVQATQKLGAFAKGERPLALRHTFQRADGSVIDMTLFSLPQVKIVDRDGVSTGLGTGDVVWVTQNTGVAVYQWADADLAVEGVFFLQMWAGDNVSQRYASDVFEYYVEERTVAPNNI